MPSQLIALTTLNGLGTLVNATDVVAVEALPNGSNVSLANGSSIVCSETQSAVFVDLQNVEAVTGTFVSATSAGNPSIAIIVNLDRVAGTETVRNASGTFERVTFDGGKVIAVASTHSAFVTLLTNNETAEGGSTIAGYTQVEADARFVAATSQLGVSGLAVVGSGLYAATGRIVGVNLSLVASDGSQYIVLSGTRLSGVNIV